MSSSLYFHVSFLIGVLCFPRCGKVCLEYDHRKLALLVLGVMMTGNFINTTAFFLAWCFSRGQDKVNKDHDNDDDEGTAQETEF